MAKESIEARKLHEGDRIKIGMEWKTIRGVTPLRDLNMKLTGEVSICWGPGRYDSNRFSGETMIEVER